MTIPKIADTEEYRTYRAMLAQEIRAGTVTLSEGNRVQPCYFCATPVKRLPVRLIVVGDKDSNGRPVNSGLAVHIYCYNQARLNEF